VRTDFGIQVFVFLSPGCRGSIGDSQIDSTPYRETMETCKKIPKLLSYKVMSVSSMKEEGFTWNSRITNKHWTLIFGTSGYIFQIRDR